MSASLFHVDDHGSASRIAWIFADSNSLNCVILEKVLPVAFLGGRRAVEFGSGQTLSLDGSSRSSRTRHTMRASADKTHAQRVDDISNRIADGHGVAPGEEQRGRLRRVRGNDQRSGIAACAKAGGNDR